MDDKELADRAVKLLGYDNDGDEVCAATYYIIPETDDKDAAGFVRDWRVAGAVMEKMTDELLVWRINYEDEDLEGGELISLQTGHAWVVEPPRTNDARQNESLPRAIIEACVSALNPAVQEQNRD